MEASSKIKVGLVGCSRISAKHLQAFTSLERKYSLTALCDINEQAIKDVQEDFPVKGYSSQKEMHERESLDLVSICTPSGLHPEQTILASGYGVNVVTEKPMATSWEEGKKMALACERAGVNLFVVKQYRYTKCLQLLKRAITEGRFGKIHMVEVNVFWSRPQEYYDVAKWRGTEKMDGGAFMNQASHYVDLLEWLVGSIAEVQCFMSTSRNIEVEDSGVLNIKWRNGALGSMNVTMLTFPKNFEASITILGESGTVRIGGLAANEIQNWSFADSKEYDDDIEQVNVISLRDHVEGKGHEMFYENVSDVLQGHADPDTDGREGLKSLEILVAAKRASKLKETVTLPLGK